MTHDWSHLDDALDAHLREEAEKPKYDAPYVSGDSIDNTCLDGWFDLGGMRKAILSAITPSDLAALIAEKCPGWQCVPVAATQSMQTAGFSKMNEVGKRETAQIYHAMLSAAPKLGDDN